MQERLPPSSDGEPVRRYRLLLVGNYPDLAQSMRRYAELLLREFSAAGISTELMCPPVFFGRLLRSFDGLGKWLGYLDKYLLFPILLRRAVRNRLRDGGLHMVHICDHSNAVYRPYVRTIPHVITCHDCLAIRRARGDFSDQQVGFGGRLQQKWIRSELSQFRHVVCVSENTARELSVLTGTGEDTYRVAHLPPYYPFKRLERSVAVGRLRGALPERFWVQGNLVPFIIHVGGNTWYKNRIGALRIFSELQGLLDVRVCLVMVGSSATSNLLELCAEKRLQEDVHFAVNCSDSMLEALYSLAEVLLFPSLAEGLGWPIIEAHACSCPVATTDAPPMNEIGGTHAAYFPHPDVCATLDEWTRSAARALRNVLTMSQGEKHEIRRRALEHAQMFGSAAMIRNLMRTHQEALSCWQEGFLRSSH